VVAFFAFAAFAGTLFLMLFNEQVPFSLTFCWNIGFHWLLPWSVAGQQLHFFAESASLIVTHIRGLLPISGDNIIMPYAAPCGNGYSKGYEWESWIVDNHVANTINC
jgi:hypothetical protein